MKTENHIWGKGDKITYNNRTYQVGDIDIDINTKTGFVRYYLRILPGSKYKSALWIDSTQCLYTENIYEKTLERQRGGSSSKLNNKQK